MRKWFFLLFILTGISSGWGQISLPECVRMALRQNPGLKIAETEVAIATEDVRQSRSALLPALDFSSSYRRQSTVPELTIPAIQLPFGGQPVSLFPGGGFQLGLTDNYDVKVTVSQPLFTGFRLRQRRQAAQAMAESKAMELAKQRQELIYRVETAYAGVLKTQKFLGIALSAWDQVAAHQRDVENFIAQGLARKDELLKVQVKMSEAELALLQAENDVKMARVALENLIGQKLPAAADFAPMESFADALTDISASSQLAQNQRPELKALDYARQARQAGKKIAAGALVPELAAFGSYGYGKPGLDFIKKDWMDYWLVGVGAEWNLWNWGKTRSQVQQAQLKVSAIAETERQVADAILLDVTQACLRLEESQKRLQLARTLEAQTQESFRVSENNYRQGQATHTDYFDAQSELTRAQLQKAQAEIEDALARANWRRAVAVSEKNYSN